MNQKEFATHKAAERKSDNRRINEDLNMTLMRCRATRKWLSKDSYSISPLS